MFKPNIQSLLKELSQSNTAWVSEQSGITGSGSVKVTVGNNTHLEGGLIANTTRDENGNLIDQGNLTLTTKTLTVSNLNNNHDSISMGGGVNAGGSTASISAQYGGEERKGLTQATIGQGTLTITEGTEPDTLNRDVTQANIVTEEHTVGGLNASLTVDTRMFSEKGRAEIEKDFKQGGILIETAVDVATKESVGIEDYNKQVGTRNNYFEAAMSFAANNPQAAKTLNDPNATPEQKQEAMSAYVNTIANQFGVSREEAVLLIATNDTTQNGEQIKGAHVEKGMGQGTIFVNDTTNNNAYQTTETLGHESAHYLEDKGAITVSGAGTEEYANIMGAASSDYFSFSYSNQGLGELSTGNNNNHVNVLNPDQPNVFNQTVVNNNSAFKTVQGNGQVEYLSYDQLSYDKASITSPYGLREPHPVLGVPRMHNGVDLAYSDRAGNKVTDSTIHAAGDGVVIIASDRGSAGQMVAVQHENGYITQYMHASELLVKVGDTVAEGQPVIIEGNTGGSKGPHLHYGVIAPGGQKIDPTTVNVGNYGTIYETPYHKANND